MAERKDPLACPTCARRYSLEERFCRHCGMPLVYAGAPVVERPANEVHARARKIDPQYTRGGLVRVAGGRNQAEAELIQNLLLEEGIPSVVRRTRGFDVPDFLAAGPRDVLVPESAYEAGRGTLHDAELVDPGAERPPAPSARHAGLVLAAIVLGAGAAALAAWALVQAAA